MKKTLLILITLFTFTLAQAQTSFKEHTAGHVFQVSLPDYLSKTTGLNNSANIEFKSTVKDVYGFIIEDTKEQLLLVDMKYTSATEFYNGFINDFLKGEKSRFVTDATTKTIGANSYVEATASYYDKKDKVEYAYYVGVVETPTTFYKVICWSTADNLPTYTADFQKILYSIKD